MNLNLLANCCDSCVQLPTLPRNQSARPQAQDPLRPQPIDNLIQLNFDNHYQKCQSKLLRASTFTNLRLPTLLEQPDTEMLADNLVFPSLIHAAFSFVPIVETVTSPATQTVTAGGGNGYKYPESYHPLYGPRTSLLPVLLGSREGVGDEHQNKSATISRGDRRVSPYSRPVVCNNPPTERIREIPNGPAQSQPQPEPVNLSLVQSIASTSRTPSLDEEVQSSTDTGTQISSVRSPNNIVAPINYVHIHQPNRNDPEELRVFETVVNFKFNIDMMEKIEIGVVSAHATETGTTENAVPVWQLELQHGPACEQKFVMKVKPTRHRQFLKLLASWFKEMYFIWMKDFGCYWLGSDELCAYYAFYPEKICKVHFKGSEEARMAEIRRQVERKFTPTILKFVVTKDSVGIVTDTIDNDSTGSSFWIVNEDTVKKMLKRLANLAFKGYFDKE